MPLSDFSSQDFNEAISGDTPFSRLLDE